MSNIDKVSFSRYGKSFQEKMCFYILEDRGFADRMVEVLSEEYFEFKYLQLFVRKIFDHKRKYSTHPSHETIRTILKSGIDGENEALQKQIRDYYARVLSDVNILESQEWVKETAIDFCRKQRLDFEKRFEFSGRETITTGWKMMDQITGGGGGRSELGVVIAPTGVGKSMVLVHLGATALKAGMTVVHYTLELKDTVIANRYDSCITGIPLDELMDRKEEIRESLKSIDGNLIVKEYPTKTATINTISAHITKLKQQGITPDMIIVDYADLLRSSTQRKEKREELEGIYEGLRAIMMEHNVVGWTASQTNRTGLNAEIITMQSISEAFNKCFVADLIFSVSRTAEDKQKNTGRIYIAKNRNGPDGLVYSIFMDTANIDIKIVDKYNPEEAPSPTLSEQEKQKFMLKKYKELVKGVPM
jgi:replicative DNA helicase